MTPSPREAFRLWSEGEESIRAGAFEKAADCARRAVTTIEALLPDRGGKAGELILVRSLGLLGQALREQGLYAEAEAPIMRAIETAEGLKEPRQELVAGAWNNLGVLCKFAGWFDRGAEAYARALPLAADHPMTLATVLHNIGGLDHARGRFDSAEEPSRRAWEIRREHLGEEDLATLADAVAYAAVLDGLRRYGESRPIYERALAVYERVFGPEHYETAATLHNLALVERADGHEEKALELARRSYEIKKKLFGTRHPDTGLSAMSVASMLPGKEESRELLSEALAAFEASLDPDHPHLARCRQLLDVRR
jgi:tetratricopeptide (TPR) repeat protein